MPLIFITGNSGTGKSAVRDEIKCRGFEAHDTDEDGITTWRNIASNEIVERPDEKDRPEDWYEKNEWRMSRQKVEELATRAKTKPIFLCGSPSNADDTAELYDKVFCLVVDEATIRDRLANRTNNDYGKSPDELEDVLGWHGPFEDHYKKSGAIMIDATKPLSEVVDDIINSSPITAN